MKLRLAIIGCGGISRQYAEHIQQYRDQLDLAGAMDLDFARAEAFCSAFGGKPYRTFDEVLVSDDIDAIVNLTVHHAHFELNARALKAHKHVYSEKPMALTHAQALELCKLAKENGCRLAAAPTTWLGEGVQTAARFLEGNTLGALRLVYAEVNWGQIERWISAPASYYTVGPLLDVGVYAITALTFLLGPVREVWGSSHILKPTRCGKDGVAFPVTAPDFTVGMMRFESGVVARITTNYYVPTRFQPHLRGFEFHGDEGSFVMSDYHDFNSKCHFYPYAGEGVEVPLVREGAPKMDRAAGLVDLAQAIRDGRPHRASAEHAAHVIEVMEGLQKSSDESRRFIISSCFEQAPVMSWAAQATMVHHI